MSGIFGKLKRKFNEINEIEEYFNTFGEKVPDVLYEQIKRVRQAVSAEI